MRTSLRILIVEDVKMEVELLQRTLKIFESILGEPEIFVTNTFAGAVEFVRASIPIDIVILDLNLDDSDMKQTLRNVRQIEDYAPTFLLTGHSKEEVESLLAVENSSHIKVLEKGPSVYNKGFLTGIVATVITLWHARRHQPMREAMKILEGYSRPNPPPSQ